MQPHQIILDTDIGTDVDDIMALALILASPELNLLGVTGAYGDTALRAKLSRRVLDLAGREDVPVLAGRPETLSPRGPAF
ncbi:MAG TPA: nucleoside hydrolase, partial [Deinococcales bacterium]|nr:nucleoside hydrolase [Deinococcales bacterium]